MSTLSSGLSPVALSKSALPAYGEHHKAKHRLLTEYMKVWIPKLGQTYPQTAIVDGFSNAGRYRDNRLGSPLIFLQGYLEHAARDRLRSPPHFVFIESNRKFAMHLQHEVSAIGDLNGAEVDVLHGEYKDEFPRVVEWLTRRYNTAPLPTFAFVDPRGYEDAPFDLLRAYRARLGTKAEAMTYVPIDFMARFIGTTLTQNALDKLFGSREAWEEVRQQAAPGAEASESLVEAYARVLREEFDSVSRFVVDPASRNRYYLFFGTDHIDGLKAMKAAYWRVDPEDGRGYKQDVLTHYGQTELFAPAIETPKAPEQDLAQLLRDHFGTRVFSIEDAELYALTDTGFRETHVREMVLYPAHDAGTLRVVETSSKRARAFPPGTRMCFLS